MSYIDDDISDISTDVFTKPEITDYRELHERIGIYDEPNARVQNKNTARLKKKTLISDKNLEESGKQISRKKSSTYNKKRITKKNEVPVKEILIGNVVILVIFITYSIFSNRPLKLELSLLCIITMVCLNWFQRKRYGKMPSINDYRFLLTGGIYAIIPKDILFDLIPILELINDILIIWVIVLICFLAERTRP